MHAHVYLTACVHGEKNTECCMGSYVVVAIVYAYSKYYVLIANAYTIKFYIIHIAMHILQSKLTKIWLLILTIIKQNLRDITEHPLLKI